MYKPYSISGLRGEFDDRETESEYSSFYIEGTNSRIKLTIKVLAVINALFIIPDYFAISDRTIFMSVFYDRCFFSLAVFIFCFWLSFQENQKYYFNGVTVMEVFASSIFLHIYWLYENANFTIQILGLVTAMVSFVIIHNRWIYVMMVNTYLTVGFVAVTIVSGNPAGAMTLVASTVYCVIIGGLLLISDLQLNVYKRRQYADNMKLMESSLLDPLTKVANRMAFEKEIEMAVELWNRYGNSFSVAMFDIDDFKLVNDTYGHLEGDRVLARLAALVEGQIRNVDFFARWGGEEFVIILPETDSETTLRLIERIRKSIRDDQTGKVKITCSFGVTQVNEMDTKESILNRVDDCLYSCKKGGKDMVMHDMGTEAKVCKEA